MQCVEILKDVLRGMYSQWSIVGIKTKDKVHLDSSLFGVEYFGIFYRNSVLVINGKNNNDDGK